MELGETIPVPFPNPVFDYVVVERKKEETVILLFAAPEEVVSHYTGLFEKVKLRPIAADVSPLCAYRLFYIARQMKRDDHILLIQFDQTSVNVSAFYEHKPAFMRHFPLEPYEEMEIDKASPFIDPFEDIYDGRTFLKTTSCYFAAVVRRIWRHICRIVFLLALSAASTNRTVNQHGY